MRRKSIFLVGMLLGPFAAGAARAANLEETLNARWRGGWVIVRPAVASSCDGFYNDNDLVGSRVDSKARRRFGTGELAHVERIEAKRNRIDVFLDIAEGVLEPRQDGPFTLYEPRVCKVQLRIPSNEKDDTARAARMADLFELHETALKAEASSSWNGRRREPFPKGYEQTLADYESWKADQVNAAVQRRMDDAIDEAVRLKERIRSDPEYLDGFGAGVEKVRDPYLGACETLAGAYFSPASAPGGKGGDWKRGYEDGQRLAWDLELLSRLRSCFVPVPQAER